MTSNVAEIGLAADAATPARVRRLGGFGAGAAALAALALVSALPLTFTATANLAFEVAAQPPASAVRGIGQVLGSRALARDALEKLTSGEVARLATDSLFPAAASGGLPALAGQAARRVAQAVAVVPVNGGRGFSISVSAPSPALAVRLADAYVAAALELDAQPAPETAGRLPGLGRGTATLEPMLPDLPGPLPFTLLAAAAVSLLIGWRQQRRKPPPEGLLDRADLPRQLDTPHRISWLDGHDAQGLDLDEAVSQLLPHATTWAEGPTRMRGRLVCVTSDGLPDAAGRCARALARRLADDAGVVLVVLDRAASPADLVDIGCEAADPGIRELLLGRARFGEALHRDPHSRAHVIPPGHLPPGWTSATGNGAMGPDAAGPDASGAGRLGILLDALRQTYDYVVVANPPLAPDHTGLDPAEPLMVCLTADTAPATAAVESFDALAALRFSRIVMLRFATGATTAEAAEPPPVVAPPPAPPAMSRLVMDFIPLKGAA
ncbi:hypothetical protein V5F53_05930 [Xanthobacter sp. V4C-4]|uniref:hypothetical protein n=1 Tax=Xanthobacter cornucopiae TaxID=3119924 RepID=UPI00372902CB